MDQVLSKIRSHVEELKRVRSLEDAYQSVAFRVTGMVLVTAIVVWISSKSSRKPRSKKTRKDKKTKNANKEVRTMTEEETIDHVLEKFRKEYEVGLNKLVEEYDDSAEEMKYQRNFYNEMLLHLLLDLDGVHLDSLEGERKEQVRLQRKAAIKKIQLELKKLDHL